MLVYFKWFKFLTIVLNTNYLIKFNIKCFKNNYPDVKVLRVGLGDKLGLKSDGDTQCLNDLVGDGDDGAEVIEKFKCNGS